MGYDINGWQSGPRRPITHNLRAGQMRGMGRVRAGSGDTIINNIFTSPNNGMVCHYCDESSGIPTWAKIAMGVGGGFSAIGSLIGALNGGGGETEGAGGEEKTQPQTTKLSKFEQAQQAIKMLGKEYSVSSDTDGNITYVYTDKDGTRYEGKNIGELNQKIIDAAKEEKAAKEVKPENKTTATDNSNKTATTNELKDGAITSAIDGKLGENSKISGIVTNNADGTIGIKDNKHTFTYEKTSKTITYNGEQYPVYSLKGATYNTTGKAIQTTAQEYILINGQLTQPADCTELEGLGTGSLVAPPPDETTPVTTKPRATKKTKKTTNKTASDSKTEKKTAPQTEYTSNYTVSTRSGSKCSIKTDKNGKYHYFDKSGKEISEAEYKKQTGMTGKETMAKVARQNEVNNWNKAHPNHKVTLKGSQYSTTVNTVQSGNVQVTANSFSELKTKVNNVLNRANASNTSKYKAGGYGSSYAALGQMMQH